MKREVLHKTVNEAEKEKEKEEGVENEADIDRAQEWMIAVFFTSLPSEEQLPPHPAAHHPISLWILPPEFSGCLFDAEHCDTQQLSLYCAVDNQDHL
ncbi:hypothetical protein PAMA_014076 [Pampus argenteus]